MNLRRVTPGDWAVGVCGAVLVGSLWLPWYGAFGPGESFFDSLPNGGATSVVFTRHHLNAWQSFAVNDVILLIAGLLAIGLVVATAGQASGAIPIALAVFTSLAGILAAVLAIVRLIWIPDVGIAAERLYGAGLGVAAAIGLAATALFAQRSEHRGGEGLAQVEVTLMPAPRPHEGGGGA